MKRLLFILFLAVSVASHGVQKAKPKPIIILSPRITNGMTAKMGQFKYQVGLRVIKEDRSATASICAGTLISPSWILTSAACIDGASKVYAYLQSTTFKSGRLVPVYQWIIHGEWDEQTSSNNICLLRIRTFNSKSNIAPVTLDSSESSYVNESVIASGWGYTSDDKAQFSSVLQYAHLKVVPNTVCLDYYGPNVFKDTNICVQGPKGTSTCGGDGGAPLVSELTGALVGIDSYGSKSGCTKGFPTAFTRVSSYKSWIEDVTGM